MVPENHYSLKANCPVCAKITGLRTRGFQYLGVHGKYRKNRSSFKIFSKRITKLYSSYYIDKAKEVHNNYYSYKPLIGTPTNIEQYKLDIICPIHGDFNQTIKAHLNGQGCPKCGHEKALKSVMKSFKYFTDKAKKVHTSHNYVYNKDTYINMSTKTTITCPIHGNFEQLPISHVKGHGCSKCASLTQGSSPASFKGINTLFYIVELINGVYKIGITTQLDIKKRYAGSKGINYIKNCVFEIGFLDGFDARTFEIALIKKLKPFRYEGEHGLGVKNVEIFTINPTDIVLQLLKQQFKS